MAWNCRVVALYYVVYTHKTSLDYLVKDWKQKVSKLLSTLLKPFTRFTFTVSFYYYMFLRHLLPLYARTESYVTSDLD